MFQRFPIALAQVQSGNISQNLLNEVYCNTSENALNEIRQLIYSLYQAKEVNLKSI